ncbi:MAG TPA: hypothetical protein VG371_02550 [Solirubrobacteraceae bacterium]|nr:hypothetical protein [Solirubrobacteraceae bacterium]
MDERERELDAARLALVALLAVITEEQLGSVKTALQAISGLSATSEAALGELSRARGRQWLAREEDVKTRQELEAALAALAEPRRHFDA